MLNGKVLSVLVFSLTFLSGKLTAGEEVSAPKLVVVVVVDQLGSDLLEHWSARYRNGLLKLRNEAERYPNAYQAHGITETCAGHASLSTGRFPREHGIVANYWIDRSSGQSTNCVSSPANRIVGRSGAAGAGTNQLQASTLGDWLKRDSPEHRVFSIAGKDRAAIMLGGTLADGVFWYAPGLGFTTYLRPGEEPAGRIGPIFQFNGELGPVSELWNYSDASCASYASTYALPGLSWASGLPNAAAPKGVPSPPMLDSLTLDGAEFLIESAALGQGPKADLLFVGLSGTDVTGHAYGTHGPEMCDQLTRLDQRLGSFLRFIEERHTSALVVLTADHGSSDMPERLKLQHPSALRFSPAQWLSAINGEIARDTKLNGIQVASARPDILTQLTLVDKQHKPVPPDLRARTLIRVLEIVKHAPHVRAAFIQNQLRALARGRRKSPGKLTLGERMALSANPAHGPDILVALAPYQYSIDATPGVLLATHGGPYDYDRRIPLFIWSPHAKGAAHSKPVYSVDLAPTLASVLNIAFPSDIDGECLSLFSERFSSCTEGTL